MEFQKPLCVNDTKNLILNIVKKILHKKKVIEKICPICGKIFEQSYKSQKYCSKECALASKSKKPDLQHFFSQTHVFGILAKEYGVDLKTIRN